MMSEKKRFIQSKYANHLQDTKTDIHYYLTSEKIGCMDLFDEIERLTEENGQLREINKELGDDLYNCRVNKNIISKILKLWENTLAEYDIYTIKDFTESFELDAKINKEKDEKIKELQVKVLNLELEKEELMKNE